MFVTIDFRTYAYWTFSIPNEPKMRPWTMDILVWDTSVRTMCMSWNSLFIYLFIFTRGRVLQKIISGWVTCKLMVILGRYWWKLNAWILNSKCNWNPQSYYGDETSEYHDFPSVHSFMHSIKRTETVYLNDTDAWENFVCCYFGNQDTGREADQSRPPSGEAKNAWSYTSTPRILLHGVMLS